MKITLSALKSWVDLASVEAAEIARLLTSRGLEVEAVRRQDAGLEQVVTAQILEKTKHPEADRLSLCKVSVGEATPALDIVCGAQNMKQGDVVCLAQVGALLPNGLKIEKSKIRGQVSHGMLCSAEELGLKEKSDGIIILPPGMKLGRPVAEVFGLDDTVFELSITPNRGDCLSVRGISRELAAALGKPLLSALTLADWRTKGAGELSTRCSAGENASAFFAVKIDGVKIGPSPDWLVRRLESFGSRSINNVVDATNWVMMELGHPVHAYDASKVEARSMEVRMSKSGEALTLLDGTQLSLKGAEIVIADAKNVLGLAGVMGGKASQVTEGTKDVVLECAIFDPSTIRAAAKAHGLHTDASARFEKGVDGAALSEVLGRLTYWVLEIAGGKIAAFSEAKTPAYSARKPIRVTWDPARVGRLLGMEIDAKSCNRELEKLGFEVSAGEVTVPSWRQDIQRFEDLVEEVARSVGYDRIPATLPAFVPNVAKEFGRFERLEWTRDVISNQGFLETLHFAFVSGSMLQSYGVSPTVRVQNPMSEVGEWLVPSLLPQMLESVVYNTNQRFGSGFGSEPMPIRYFQLRPTFSAQSTVHADGTHGTGVTETWNVAIVMSGPAANSPYLAEHRALDFLDLKGAVTAISEKLGVRGIRFKSPQPGSQPPELYHPGQTAELWVGKQRIGWLGALHPKIAHDQKMRERCWIAEWDWDLWSNTAAFDKAKVFKTWKEQPRMERDFSLEIPRGGVSAEQILSVALKAGHPVAETARIFDTYRAEGEAPASTSIAVRVMMTVEGRSIVEQDADVTSQKILDAWKRELGVGLKGG